MTAHRVGSNRRTLRWLRDVVAVALVVLVCTHQATCAPAAAEDRARSSSPVTTFYVSTTGSDSNPGTAAAPFKTVSRAQAAVRSVKAKQGGTLSTPVTVLLAGGVYPLTSPLEFSAPDSGTAECPVTYISQDSTGAVISGGVPVTGWKVSSRNVTRNGRVAAATAWTAQLPASTKYFRQLWINGQRRTMARTPVMAYATATPSYIVAKAGQLPTTSPHNAADVTVVLFESWTASIHQIASIDAGNLTVFLRTKYNDQWSGNAAGSRYYLQNMLEALDTPGEFYYDRTSHVLTYLPLPDEKPDAVDAVVPQLVELVTGVDSSGGATPAFLEYVNFVNLTFAHSQVDVSSCFASSCDGQSASFLTTATLRFNASRYVNLAGVSIGHTGGYGVWFNKATFNNTISRCHFYDLGAGAVRLGPPQSGVESDATMRSEGNVVSDSLLEDGGYYYKEGCGVLAQQVASTSIVHNVIRYFKYTGVSVGWTWGYAATSVHDNIVGWNLIHHIGNNTLSDMGCVYTLGIQPGTTIINNVCHDVWSFNYGGWGYYTDEGSSNITNTQNIVYHTKCAGYHQHYGLNNLMLNNVVADVNQGNCDGAVRSSQHPGKCKLPAKGEAQGRCSSFSFVRNIVYQPSGPMFYETIPTGFQNMSFANNTYWRTQDPNSIVFPTSVNDTSLAQWRAEGKDLTSVVANPDFVDPQGLDFSHLEPSSPALVMEHFVPIDVSTVGPRPPASVQPPCSGIEPP